RRVLRAARRARHEPACGGVAGAVEPQPAAAVHPGGDVVEPPADQVEVMAGLVHEQPARALLVAVPAAEVVGAVRGVQQPLEVHRGDLADAARREELAQRAVARRVAVVERHDHRAAGARGEWPWLTATTTERPVRSTASAIARTPSTVVVSGFSTTASAPPSSTATTWSACVASGEVTTTRSSACSRTAAATSSTANRAG